MQTESKQQVLERRKELEQEIVDMLKETESDFELADVLNAIYEEEESDGMGKIIAMFDNGDISILNNVLELVTDAWNYFPHKSLGGISPSEKLLEYEKSHPAKPKSKKGDAMPRVRVGNREMSWDEHQAMLEEMTRAQEPFKKWIAGVLADYKSFLKQEGLSAKTVDKHYFVAETFFDRVIWLGWLDFGSIRKEFISDEFPKWWMTHVVASGINDQKEIKSSVRKLVDFIDAKYAIK
ncbi:MAG: hypothetical protein KGI50_05750 [Patescibacteria group bacterium]|nr:hypothetical protein [Patescibacteria group bacterium]MDE1971047.1 hypothetical protein [Patescibacteria group bacterium]